MKRITAWAIGAILIAGVAWAGGQFSKRESQSVAIATDQVGTAGTAASDVLTVQGVASMTPLQVQGGSGSTPLVVFDEANDGGTQYATISITTQGAADAGLNGTAVTGLGAFHTAALHGKFVGTTGGTIDLYLQSFDGTNWVDYCHFASLAADAVALEVEVTVSRSLPSTIYGVGSGIITTGNKVLAAGDCIGGDWGDRFRLVSVTGSGVDAGQSETIFATLSY